MKLTTHSLRLRLLLGTLAWIFALLAAGGWVLDDLFARHVARQFRSELQVHLQQLAANLDFDAAGRPQLLRPLSDPRLQKPLSGLYWQVDRMPSASAPAGVALLRSRSLWDSRLDVPPDALGDGEQHQHQVRGPKGEALRMIEQVLRYPGDGAQALRLIVAADERLLDEPRLAFSGSLILALLVLALGLVAAVVIQVVLGLRPLARLQRDLAALHDGQRNRLDASYPAEVQPLVDELNSVLERNARFVERARQQAGNLAHAVKTPLAVMANAAAGDPAGLPDIVRTQVEQARQQVDYHLSRARAAATAQGGQGRCELRPAIEGLLRVMRLAHVERDLQITLQVCPELLTVRGEAQDIQEMIGNLLDNACKWADGQVQVRVEASDAFCRVDVDDDGPGIPAAQRQQLLQRGERGDECQPGSGLGLAIVDELATLYGGRLELLDAPLGGLRARLLLPTANRSGSEVRVP